MSIQKDIEEFEKKGISVVSIDGEGKLYYSTQDADGDEYCDHCKAFRLLPDPDPHDWFRETDMKAVCLEVNGVISGSLETPSEYVNIHKPLYCPKLGRKLNEDEKNEANERLICAYFTSDSINSTFSIFFPFGNIVIFYDFI